MHNNRRGLVLGWLFSLAAFLAVETSLAQEVSTRPPLQPADTSSFQATLNSFLDASNELYTLAETDQTAENFRDRVLPAAERMKDCLDLNDLLERVARYGRCRVGCLFEGGARPHRATRRRSDSRRHCNRRRSGCSMAHSGNPHHPHESPARAGRGIVSCSLPIPCVRLPKCMGWRNSCPTGPMARKFLRVFMIDMSR